MRQRYTALIKSKALRRPQPAEGFDLSNIQPFTAPAVIPEIKNLLNPI